MKDENLPNGSEFLFANAIRAGDTNEVQSIMEDYPTVLQSKLSFRIRLKVDNTALPSTFINGIGNTINGKELETAKMHVSPLQLAIISKQESVVRMILEHVYASNDDGEEALEIVMDVKSVVVFPRDSPPTLYEEDDRMLDGMNIFHLAAKFHPKSLYEIISFLNKEDLTELIDALIQEKDPHVECTPLHVAAKSPSSFAMR